VDIDLLFLLIKRLSDQVAEVFQCILDKSESLGLTFTWHYS